MRNKKGFVLVGLEIPFVLALIGVTVFGAIQTEKGEYGKDGAKAVKNCPGIHVNDNCAHMRIDDL